MALVPTMFAGSDPVEIAMVIILLVLCLAFHEVAHGWVALKCGDTTARDLGRLTLNPVPHIDLFMTILLPAMLYFGSGGRFVFGGAKPVPVSFHRLRHPWRDMSLVAVAGPLSNLLLALFFVVAWKFFMRTGYYNSPSAPYLRHEDFLPRILFQAIEFNVVLAVFNLVPIPPLDGSRVMAWLLPEHLRPAYVGLERFGMIVIFALLYLSPGFNGMIVHARNVVIDALDALVPIPLQA